MQKEARQTGVLKNDCWSLCRLTPSYLRNLRHLFGLEKNNMILHQTKIGNRWKVVQHSFYPSFLHLMLFICKMFTSDLHCICLYKMSMARLLDYNKFVRKILIKVGVHIILIIGILLTHIITMIINFRFQFE